MSQNFDLRLERGGEHIAVACCTKMGISQLIHKIYRCMIYQEIADFQAF